MMDTLNQTQDSTQTQEVTDAPVEGRQFSYHDKCDSCRFQAFFVAQKPRTEPAPGEWVDDAENFELKFCKHHGDKVAPGLAMDGWNVLDFTHMLNEKPSPSASEIDPDDEED